MPNTAILPRLSDIRFPLHLLAATGIATALFMAGGFVTVALLRMGGLL